MGNKNSGNKLSTTEYVTRKVVDVAAAAVIPLTAYLIAYNGPEIIAGIKTTVTRIRNRRK